MISKASRLTQRIIVGLLCGGAMVGPVVATLVNLVVRAKTYQGAHDLMLWCCLMSAAVVTGLGVADLGRELNQAKTADVARRSP